MTAGRRLGSQFHWGLKSITSEGSEAPAGHAFWVVEVFRTVIRPRLPKSSIDGYLVTTPGREGRVRWGTTGPWYLNGALSVDFDGRTRYTTVLGARFFALWMRARFVSNLSLRSERRWSLV